MRLKNSRDTNKRILAILLNRISHRVERSVLKFIRDLDARFTNRPTYLLLSMFQCHRPGDRRVGVWSIRSWAWGDCDCGGVNVKHFTSQQLKERDIMAIPDFQTIMLPLLKIFADGKEYSIQDYLDNHLLPLPRHDLPTRPGILHADFCQRYYNRLYYQKLRD